jgi:lantibiotic biosynthesis protein
LTSTTTRGRWLPILPDAGAERGAGGAASTGGALADHGAASAEAAGAEALARRAGEAVDELAAALAAAAGAGAGGAESPYLQRETLADGPAGAALFFHYLDQARPGQGHDERALALLEAAIDATSERPAAAGLYGGFAGIAWTLEHLTGSLVEPPALGEEDPGGEAAAALAEYLGRTPWQDDYDLIGGLVGFGAWGLERASRPFGEEAVASVVRRLGELAERRDGGITWRSWPQSMRPSDAQRFPQGNYNLGVAHGVPGVVGWLGELRAAGLAPDEARELLAGAVEWLFAQALPAGAASRFPYSVAPGAEPVPSRLAWCYGDPGIALTLLVAARAAGEPEWERQALAVARAAAARPRDQGRVLDGGLCHGAGGLAHLYNRLYQATGDPLWRQESLAWIERLLDQRRPGEGIAGWRSWRPLGELPADGSFPELGWVTDPGFLTGAAGIGLALLAALSPIEPAWDRLLLVSVPPRPEPESS